MDEVIGYVDVRSAEVATTAIAADVAQVHQDMLDADADASAAAASAAAAAGTLANAVKKTGEASQSIAGDVAVAGDLSAGGDLAVTGDVTGGTVTVPTPVNNTDAASKKYVDDADALKADKTYVDAQDALMIPILNINSYAVGMTGNQNGISGKKEFVGLITRKNSSNTMGYQIARSDFNYPPDATKYQDVLSLYSNDNTLCGWLQFQVSADGRSSLRAIVKNSDGSLKYVTLAAGDVI